MYAILCLYMHDDFRHTKSAGILNLFDKVVVAAEVPNGKPAPDVYLKAAELIGANPAKCRAYEVYWVHVIRMNLQLLKCVVADAVVVCAPGL